MSPDSVFRAASTIALLSWILLALLGRQRWVSRVATAVFVPGLLAVAYAAIIALHFGSSKGNFNTLHGVAELFADPWLLLAGWIHYLAFDLFIGTWEVRDAMLHKISHWLVVPCLFLTFLFGPIGLLAYLALRASLRRQIVID